MRAIFDCETTYEGKIDEVVEKCHWLPSKGVEKEYLDKKRDEVIASLPQEVQERVRSTVECVIFDRTTETWGTVTVETTGILTFRLKNPDADKLRRATERLVEEIDNYSVVHGNHLKLPEHVQILQANVTHLAFNGTIVLFRKGTFRFALKEKQTEVRIVQFALAILFLLLVATFPYVKKTVAEVFSNLSQVNGPLFAEWVFGNLDRLTTSMLTTIVVAALGIAFYYSSLRQQVRNRSGKATKINWNE